MLPLSMTLINYLFPHLAAAAFLAISDLFLADSFSARAFPPFSPPSLPKATAAGFFSLTSMGAGSTSPVARSTMDFANWLVSLGRVGFFAMQ